MHDATIAPAAEPGPAGPAGEKPPTKRERSKQEKRARILAAARTIFGEKGFSAATVQEIAARARVANGTVFLYARSKEELLLQVFAGDINEVLAEAEASLPAGAGTLAQLLHVFNAIADYHHGLGAPLSAVLVRELMHGPADIMAEPNSTFARTDKLLMALIDGGRERGELSARLDTREAAAMLFSIFHWVISQWALGRISFETFKDQLRSRFALCIVGMERAAPSRP